MKTERIRDAAQVLDWLRTQVIDNPQSGDGGAVMAANLALAGAYLAGYAEHVAKGRTPGEALLATARCEFGDS